MMGKLQSEREISLLRALHSTSPISGFTHNFYRYPARMSPEFARAAITLYSEPHDVILDPFLGGGTTVVEALANGRRSIGVDLNPLATFVASAKTTPLSKADESIVTQWAEMAPVLEAAKCQAASNATSHDPRLKNLPATLENVFEKLISYVLELPYPRQRQFARCVLLRLGQWAVDGKTGVPELGKLVNKLQLFVQDMFSGLDHLVQSAATSGEEKRSMTGYRSINLRSAIGLEEDLELVSAGRPRLVLTSPPYPAVHVLYHRWQVNGRRETPAPYWLIDAPDGHGASYFTMGDRSQFGVQNYFRNLTMAFRSVRRIIHPDGVVVQLVSFPQAETQLPSFLQAMEKAGFSEEVIEAPAHADRWRTVPNRQWYYRTDATRKPAQELLLVHRPIGNQFYP